MNKLLLKPQLHIVEDGFYFLEGDCSSKVEIFVLPNVICTLLLSGNFFRQELEIHIEENAQVFYQSFLKDVDSHIQVFLEGKGANLKFVDSRIAHKKCGLYVQIFHTAPHTESCLYNSIVNYGEELSEIQVDASVPKGVCGCRLMQDNRILLAQNGKGKVLPNLWIDEFDCFAEHSAYISKFRDEELFYLLSRGISKKDATFLLTKSLLLGKMQLDEEFRAKFTDMIQDMGR